jgi:anaerobic selenocysteine-containing dehydrogenase
MTTPPRKQGARAGEHVRSEERTKKQFLHRAQPPIETDGLVVKEPAKVSGGAKAVQKALQHMGQGPGVFRGLPALYRLNQFGGVDCPGCAWPDPDDRRSANEYCENGAKAIAEEATSKRLSPEFFKQWSISQLSEQSDFWLGHQGRLTHPMVLRATTDNYEPISWQDAFALIAQELHALENPDQAIFILPAAPATKPHSSISSLFANSAPTISPTARTCATNPPVPR